jgi:hypothetical protein
MKVKVEASRTLFILAGLVVIIAWSYLIVVTIRMAPQTTSIILLATLAGGSPGVFMFTAFFFAEVILPYHLRPTWKDLFLFLKMYWDSMVLFAFIATITIACYIYGGYPATLTLISVVVTWLGHELFVKRWRIEEGPYFQFTIRPCTDVKPTDAYKCGEASGALIYVKNLGKLPAYHVYLSPEVKDRNKFFELCGKMKAFTENIMPGDEVAIAYIDSIQQFMYVPLVFSFATPVGLHERESFKIEIVERGQRCHVELLIIPSPNTPLLKMLEMWRNTAAFFKHVWIYKKVEEALEQPAP